MSRDKAERAGLADSPSFGACPVPRTDTDRVLLGHGSGGLLTAQLIEDLILPAFRNPGARSRSTTRRCWRCRASRARAWRSPPTRTW